MARAPTPPNCQTAPPRTDGPRRNKAFKKFHSLDPTGSRRFQGELVGVPGFEPGTSSLSGTRSNQLSYTPESNHAGLGPDVRVGGARGTRTLDIQLAKLAL